jgi:hypothetical protein
MQPLPIVVPSTPCQSFPQLDEPQVLRENILNTLDTLLLSPADLVIVEGEDGIGKTTLLAQFTLSHQDRCLALFLRSSSRWAYDPMLMRLDLCNQLSWLTEEKELLDASDATDEFLRTHFHLLQRLAMRRQRIYYVVVDGLDEIPDSVGRRSIVDLLPIGLQRLKFLLGGAPDNIDQFLAPSIRSKSFPLPGFTLDESKALLRETEVGPEELLEFHKICHGAPGYLATVKRMLGSGVTAADLLHDMPSKLPDLFTLEWSRLVSNARDVEIVLAVIAFAARTYTVTELSAIVRQPPEIINEQLKRLSFIEALALPNEVMYVSDAFRKFARSRLDGIRQTAHGLVIDHLLAIPTGDEALEYLPDQLEQAGRFDDLVTYLSPENLSLMLDRSQSIVPVTRKTTFGLSAARMLHRDDALMRFAVQRSLLKTMDGTSIWRSEIEARMALREYDEALALAQAAPAREDRLRLLCLVAKLKRQADLPLEPELIDQARQLLDQIDPRAFSDKAFEIAADMLFVSPQLGIDFIEKATQSDTDGDALDWSLALLSAKLRSETDRSTFTNQQRRVAGETIGSRIKDPHAKRFFDNILIRMGDYSFREVVAELEKMPKVADRLRFLGHWTAKNPERHDAGDAVLYALKVAITATDYTPNAYLYCQIARPLLFMNDDK